MSKPAWVETYACPACGRTDAIELRISAGAGPEHPQWVNDEWERARARGAITTRILYVEQRCDCMLSVEDQQAIDADVMASMRTAP